MLPAPRTHRWSLADVMPSCLDSLAGRPDALGLGPASKAAVLLVDGLGTHPLMARAGHARTLAPLVTRASTIASGFPSTTASAIATLTTGTFPGQHGLVGYSVLDPEHDRVVNQLSGWDDRLDPASWQRSATAFEQAARASTPSFVVGPERYRSSGFTAAVLRGAEYRPAKSIADRLTAVRSIFDAHPRALVYAYVPELDQAAHSAGNDSTLWTSHLETVDSAVRGLADTLRSDEGMLVTADHGGVDIPSRSHVLFDGIPGLTDDVRHVAGEPRCLQLHLEPGRDPDEVAARWRESESGRSWVVTRSEAIDSGWFGPTVDEAVAPRIGDVIVAARSKIAYYDSRAPSQTGRAMIGQHGSFSPEETAIPLLRFGSFAT